MQTYKETEPRGEGKKIPRRSEVISYITTSLLAISWVGPPPKHPLVSHQHGIYNCGTSKKGSTFQNNLWHKEVDLFTSCDEMNMNSITCSHTLLVVQDRCCYISNSPTTVSR